MVGSDGNDGTDGIDGSVGDVVTLNIVRDGKSESVSFTVTEDCMIEY